MLGLDLVTSVPPVQGHRSPCDKNYKGVNLLGDCYAFHVLLFCLVVGVLVIVCV